MTKNLFEKILKSIFLCILIYIVYRSEIVWLGEQREFYLKYFFLFLLINIFIFIYYKVSNHTKKIIRINFIQ